MAAWRLILNLMRFYYFEGCFQYTYFVCENGKLTCTVRGGCNKLNYDE